MASQLPEAIRRVDVPWEVLACIDCRRLSACANHTYADTGLRALSGEFRPDGELQPLAAELCDDILGQRAFQDFVVAARLHIMHVERVASRMCGVGRCADVLVPRRAELVGQCNRPLPAAALRRFIVDPILERGIREQVLGRLFVSMQDKCPAHGQCSKQRRNPSTVSCFHAVSFPNRTKVSEQLV